jgi:predicted lipid-binding transport protein (Tim44 family)
MHKLLSMVCAGLLALGLSVQDVEAKRLGGGASKGMQRDSAATQKQAAPQQQAPTQEATGAPSAIPGTAAQAPRQNWMGPLAGLAAGIGLAALLAHLGLGEGLAEALLIMLLVAAVVVVFRILLRRRTTEFRSSSEPLQYAGVGGPGMGPAPEAGFEPAATESLEPGDTRPVQRIIPSGFDQEGFLSAAKLNFFRLQAASDAGNLDDIREFTTPEMFAEISIEVAGRHGAAQTTDVAALEAELLEVVSEPARHIASVRFLGLIREDLDLEGAAVPFDEVWHLTKPVDGSRGWVVAGIQQLN